jgi:hypothetical protein
MGGFGLRNRATGVLAVWKSLLPRRFRIDADEGWRAIRVLPDKPVTISRSGSSMATRHGTAAVGAEA